MNNNDAQNTHHLPDEKSPRRYLHQYGAQVLLGSLFLLLICYTGTLVGAFSGQPHLTALIVTCSLLTGLCLWPSSDRRGAPRFAVLFWRKYEKLPTNLLLPLAAWLVCGALATWLSSIPSLSYETFGSHLWVLLVAALIYCYAAQGVLQVLRVVGAMIVALDAAILLGVWQYFTYWLNPARDTSFHAQHSAVTSLLNDTNAFGHFLALTLPLALWDAARAHAQIEQFRQGRQRAGSNQRLKRKYWAMWRVLRPGLIIGLSAATTSRSSWLGILAVLVFMGALLLHRHKTVHGGEKTTYRELLRPYRTSLIVGLVLTCGVAVQQNTWFRQRLAAVVAPADFGNSGRGAIWRNTLRLSLKRPVFGWGPGTFAVNYPQSFRRTDVREVVLQAHNTYLNRLMEEGALALVFWFVFIAGIWQRGLRYLLRRPDTPDLAAINAKNPESVEPWMIEKGYSLLPALLAGVLAYGVTGFFVMSEQIPTMMVYFHGYLALILALVFNDNYRALRRPGSQPSPVARGLALAGALAFLFHAPALWRSVQARIIFDDALSSESPADRVGMLRQARDLDPGQPVYWGQLGLARLAAEGEPAARSIANLFRAAANRSPSDAVWWHNTGMLYLLAGDSTGAIRNALRATKYDGTNSFFQAALADAYELDGQLVAAAARRERARQFDGPPITQRPPEGVERSDASYFCRTLGGRYRRVVTECEIIRPKGYTRQDALFSTDNRRFYTPRPR